jgi:hypothetical protein
MGDLILMFWLGFFLGFWSCVLVHVWYGILRPRWRARTHAKAQRRQEELWQAARTRCRLN